MHAPIATPAAAAPAGTPVTFTGVRRRFLGLIARGAVLEVVTLGFYRFWLATDIRRHLWSNTAVGGDAAEYTGRAKELLIGFLVAMAILMPIYLLYFVLGIEAELVQAFASIPLILFFYFFSQFALYRARRYRLTRTVWRGLRFSMGGSGWSYAWRAGAWTLLAVMTLGLAFPWRQAALERYKLRNTAYGTLRGRFEGTGLELFKRGWWLWLLLPTAILLIPAPFLYAVYKATEWRWWIGGVRFGAVRLDSAMTRGALVGTVWKVVGWYHLIVLGFSVLIGMMAMPLFDGGAAMANPLQLILANPAYFALLMAGYLMMAVAMGIVLRLYMNRDVWAKVAATTMVYGLAAADDVVGQGEAVDALGEGLTDGLDIGGL